MQVKAFRFGRLSSSQFSERTKELNTFLSTVAPVGLPQIAANDEEGTIMFVFYEDRQAPESSVKKELSNKRGISE